MKTKSTELVPYNRYLSHSDVAIVENKKIVKDLSEWLADKVRREFSSEEICEAVLAALTINAACKVAETNGGQIRNDNNSWADMRGNYD